MVVDQNVKAAQELSLRLYRKLYLIRSAERGIIAYYSEDDMKTPMHMSMGQEASSVGVCEALGDKGQIFSTYRSHAAFLARTGDIDLFFLEMYGRGGTLTSGKAGSMHLASPSAGHICSSAIVGSTIPVAAGAAFANKYTKSGGLACAFFGDGALEEGVFWETMNVSSVMRLPVLLVCEDNGLAVHTFPKTRQGFRSIAGVARQFECNVFEEEATDVEKVYRVTREAVEATRANEKPSFLRLKCYRYLEHVGVNEDFNAGYGQRLEFEEWLKKDALTLQRQRLLAAGLSEEALGQEERVIDEKIERSIQKAKKASFPERDALYRGVFYEEN